MKRKILTILLSIILIILNTNIAFAVDTDTDIGGGGGGIGSGDKDNFWTAGMDGVRVTVVNAQTGERGIYKSKKLQSINMISKAVNGNEKWEHFGKNSKIEYLNGNSLTASTTKYTWVRPTNPLPTIIHSAKTPADINITREYFSKELNIKIIAKEINIPYEILIDGNYKLLIEPMVFLTFMGVKYAMTAHEAALFDEKTTGQIRVKFLDLSHKNLPLALFLEKGDPELGLPAWTGSLTDRVSNTQIKQFLGMGLVKFKDLPSDGDNTGGSGGTGGGNDISNAQYRTNTDVILSTTFYSENKEYTTDKPATVTFHTPTGRINVEVIVPKNSSQLVWTKWRTPSTPINTNIDVTSSSGSLSSNQIKANIIELTEKTPPDPKGEDIKPKAWSLKPLPSSAKNTSASWSKWLATKNWAWQPDIIVIDGIEYDNGYWYSYWTWNKKDYNASLTTKSNLTTYSKTSFTKNNKLYMKSGYGFYLDIDTKINSNDISSNFTAGQNVVVRFPEFKYKDYFRVLDKEIKSNTSTFQFKKNPFSMTEERTHFTPIWYPDNLKYPAQVYIFDVWTPVGMLHWTGTSNDLIIDGNVYDDWYVGIKQD